MYVFSLGNEHQDASLLVNNVEQKGDCKRNFCYSITVAKGEPMLIA